MKLIPVALVAVTINRDSMTRLPVTVVAHEVEIVKAIFGEDNVQVTNENAGTLAVDPTTEGERLASKYSEDAVKTAFGENFKGAVARACIEVTEDSGSPFAAMTKAQLLEHAKAHDIEGVHKDMSKADILAAVEAAPVPA